MRDNSADLLNGIFAGEGHAELAVRLSRRIFREWDRERKMSMSLNAFWQLGHAICFAAEVMRGDADAVAALDAL